MTKFLKLLDSEGLLDLSSDFFLYMQSLQLKSKIFIMNILWDNFKYDQIYYSIYDGKCLGSPML